MDHLQSSHFYLMFEAFNSDRWRQTWVVTILSLAILGCYSRGESRRDPAVTPRSVQSRNDEGGDTKQGSFSDSQQQQSSSQYSQLLTTETENTVQSTIQLNVRVVGAKEGDGNCLIAIYADSTSFNNPDRSIFKREYETRDGVWAIELDGSKFVDDELAIAVFQDKNGNGKLDKNSFGIPTEIYGFSNDPKRGFGPPKFHETALRIGSGAIDVQITLH